MKLPERISRGQTAYRVKQLDKNPTAIEMPDEDRRRRAEQIYQFLRHSYDDVAELEVFFDRRELVAYLDALKSRDFMELVQADDALDYEIKVNISQMVSGLNKSWPQVLQMVGSHHAVRFIAVLLRLSEQIQSVKDALKVRTVIPVATPVEEIKPEPWPPRE